MRLEAAMKGGFYPAPLDAVETIAKHVDLPMGNRSTILDPCCGKGEAIAHLAGLLGFPEERVYITELEPTRYATACQTLPKARNVGAPADFTLCRIGVQGFGAIWLNPPFDSEVGGGSRVETRFLEHATPLLVPGGVLMFVLPEPVLTRSEIRGHILSWYTDIRTVPFPEPRAFKEVVVLARKRPTSVRGEPYNWIYDVNSPTTRHMKYIVPTAPGPSRFMKWGLTDIEAGEALAASPLDKLFDVPPPIPAPSPPLELSRGQMALVLAGGMLNTTIRKPGEDPVLIKATPFKEKYVAGEDSEVKGTGENEETVITMTVSERIKLKVRVMTSQGKIHDLV